jgi:protein-serine/threonine kinase
MPRAGADINAPGSTGGQDLFDFVDLHPDGLDIKSIEKIFGAFFVFLPSDCRRLTSIPLYCNDTGQLADAIAFLHRHSIVHRDIKDENIVLDRYGNVQVIDFGSAAYVREGKKFDTFSGTLE